MPMQHGKEVVTKIQMGQRKRRKSNLLREYYPKKTDLGKISNDDLIEKLILLNSRPRKCLNWDNPFNLFLKEMSHLD